MNTRRKVLTRKGIETLEKWRMEYARYAFENCQSLVRLMDQKGGLSLVVLTLLCAGLFPVVSQYFRPESSFGNERFLVILWLVCFLILAFSVIQHSILAFFARTSSIHPKPEAPEMLFPLLILAKYERTDASYLDQLKSLSHGEMLADYAHQVMELATIYEAKHEQVQAAFINLQWTVVPWLGSLLTIFAHHALLSMRSEPRLLALSVLSVIILIIGSFLINRYGKDSTLTP